MPPSMGGGEGEGEGEGEEEEDLTKVLDKKEEAEQDGRIVMNDTPTCYSTPITCLSLYLDASTAIAIALSPFIQRPRNIAIKKIHLTLCLKKKSKHIKARFVLSHNMPDSRGVRCV